MHSAQVRYIFYLTYANPPRLPVAETGAVLLFWDSDFRRDVLPERDDKSAQKSPDKLFKTLKFYGSGKPKAALRGIFADGKETISNFSVAFRTKVCFNKKSSKWNRTEKGETAGC